MDAFWDPLGSSFEPLGAPLGHFGTLLDLLWDHFGAIFIFSGVCFFIVVFVEKSHAGPPSGVLKKRVGGTRTTIVGRW